MGTEVIVNDKHWSAIAEPSRRTLIDILLKRGGLTASMLAKEVPFSRQAVTKHMAVLADAGLVTSKRDGKEVRFSVVSKELNHATQQLLSTALTWQQRLQSIKHIAEALQQEKDSKRK